MSYYKNRFRKSVPNHDIVDIAAGHPTVQANPPQIVVSAPFGLPCSYFDPGYHETATDVAISSRLREAAVGRKVVASKKNGR
jgi:hypothetical protein